MYLNDSLNLLQPFKIEIDNRVLYQLYIELSLWKNFDIKWNKISYFSSFRYLFASALLTGRFLSCLISSSLWNLSFKNWDLFKFKTSIKIKNVKIEILSILGLDKQFL